MKESEYIESLRRKADDLAALIRNVADGTVHQSLWEAWHHAAECERFLVIAAAAIKSESEEAAAACPERT